MKSIRSFFGKTPLALRIVALYVGSSIAIVLSILVFQANQPVVYATENPVAAIKQAEAVVAKAPEIQGMPTQLSVERLGLTLSVQPGYYDDQTKDWTLNDTHAFFATQSVQPGTVAGTTFIYGHNRASAFGPLADLRTGDTVTLQLEDGHVLTYEYARDAKVTPESVQVVTEKSDYPQLILMTCDGLFSEARRIMYFTLTEAM